MIFIIDDDAVMAKCIARATGSDTKIFGDAISAMSAISADQLPSLIFLDILLDGPDGFTFLNELASYQDTAKIPVILVTSLDLKTDHLATYGVRGILKKDTMTPKDIKAYVDKFAR